MDYFPIYQVIYSNGKTIIIDPKGTGTVLVENDDFISPALLDLGGKEKIRIKRRTKDYEINIPENTKTIHASDLPDSIDDVPDDIVKQVILCEQS